MLGVRSFELQYEALRQLPWDVKLRESGLRVGCV